MRDVRGGRADGKRSGMDGCMGGRTMSREETMNRGGTATRGEAMRRVRAQATLLRQLSMRMKEYGADGLASPRLDAMPRGSVLPRGLEIRVEKREAMQRMIGRESELLREYERTARAWMDGMRPELYAFCALYYLAALSLEETAEAIDRSLRQASRYKQEIERDTAENVMGCQLDGQSGAVI